MSSVTLSHSSLLAVQYWPPLGQSPPTVASRPSAFSSVGMKGSSQLAIETPLPFAHQGYCVLITSSTKLGQLRRFAEVIKQLIGANDQQQQVWSGTKLSTVGIRSLNQGPLFPLCRRRVW
jgi:hypothetical protein